MELTPVPTRSPRRPPPPNPVSLAVVIPTLNEAADVASCVRCAAALAQGWGGPVDVVVADGHSDDGTPRLAAEAGARVVTVARGRGSQLRAGVAAARGDTVLMLHADNRLPPSVGDQLAAALADTGVGWGAFRQRVEERGAIYRAVERGNAWRARRLGLPYGDQAIFVRRALLDGVGGVPDLPVMEDVALSQRLRRVAWPVLLAGPVSVSARRWRRHGVARQTLRNWLLLARFASGTPAESLLPSYRPHTPSLSPPKRADS